MIRPIRWLMTCAALALLSGCASEQKRTDRAVARLQAAAVAFDAAHHRAPRTLYELEADAARTKPLDLRPFASVELTPERGGGLRIAAVPRDPEQNGPYETPAIILGFAAPVYGPDDAVEHAGFLDD